MFTGFTYGFNDTLGIGFHVDEEKPMQFFDGQEVVFSLSAEETLILLHILREYETNIRDAIKER